MSALNENALLLEFANVYCGDNDGNAVDLGSVRNVNFTAEIAKTEVNSDNRGTIVDKVRLNGIVSFDWLEAGDASKIENLLKGLVTKTNVAGSLVSGASQVESSGAWTDRGFIKIDNQNGDGSEITVNSVTGSVDGALTVNVNYEIVKNEQGEWGIVPNTSGANLATTAQDLTIDYDYTPNASTKVTGGTTKVATPRYVKLVGPSSADPTKTRTVVLESAVADADFVLPFLDTEESGDVGVLPVTMRNGKNKTWWYEDKINV